MATVMAGPRRKPFCRGPAGRQSAGALDVAVRCADGTSRDKWPPMAAHDPDCCGRVAARAPGAGSASTSHGFPKVRKKADGRGVLVEGDVEVDGGAGHGLVPP